MTSSAVALKACDDAAAPLPHGATVNPDGSIALAVSCPLSVGSERCGPEDGGDRQLIFRRLIGSDYRKIVRAKNKLTAAVARSVGIAASVADRLLHDLREAELVALANIIDRMLPSAAIVPARAAALPDGGFLLPLLYPASDGKALHQSLRFKPLAREHLHRIGRPQQDKFITNAVHHSTMIPVWGVANLLDRMDAADFAGSYAIIQALAQRAIEGAHHNSPNQRT